MNNAIDNTGHRQRLRDRFIQRGDGGFADYELLELLLTYAIPRRDVKPLAKALLVKFPNLSSLLDAEIADLTEVPGIGANAAVLLKSCKALLTRYLEVSTHQLDLINNTARALNFARAKIGGNSKESAIIMHLDAQNQLLDYDCFNYGTVNRIVLYQREIVELCLKRHSVAIILVHNHPSGICEPSEEDKRLTAILQAALATVSISLFDHLIISPKSAFSFRKNHLLMP